MDVESFEAVAAMHGDCRPLRKILLAEQLTIDQVLQFAWQCGYQRGQLAALTRAQEITDKNMAEFQKTFRRLDATSSPASIMAQTAKDQLMASIKAARAAMFDDEAVPGARDGGSAGEI